MAVEKDVRLELGKLPAELKQHYKIIYQDILESAPSTSSIARKTFSWMLAAQRMLTVEEMIAAVALDDDGFYHSDLDIARLLDICRNLVIITSIDYASKQMAFQMVHLSVREYLEELPEFSAEQVHTVAISRLLSNFNSSAQFERDILIKEKPLRALRDYTVYLFKHAEMSLLATSECDLAPEMRSFLFDNQYNNTPMLNEWHHIVDEFRERSILTQDSPGSLTMRGFNGLDAGGLYLICRHGLLSILENLDHDEINPWQAHSSKQLSRALWEATRHGKSAIAKWLLKRQIVHPNESHTHVPPLYTAVWDQREEIVGLLLEYGADPLLRYEKGFLHTPWKMVFNQPLGHGLKYPKYNFAIFKRMFDSIERLHKETPDIESYFGYDWKLESLLEALRANWDEASHFLIRCGANDRLQRTQRADDFVNKDERQSSTLQIAVKYSKFSVIEALLDRSQKRSSNLAAQSTTSVQLESSEHLEYINYSDNHGRSAIHYLMDRQSYGIEDKEEIMGLLLKHGADPTAVSDKKHTAIHIAAAIGSTNMIRHLMAEGLDLEARDICGATALHLASGGAHRKPRVIGYLTDNGQEPLGRNSAGSTPLHYAAKSCNLPALEALLEILLGRDGLSLSEAKMVATAQNLSRSADKEFDSYRKLVDYVNVADDEGNSLLHVVGSARDLSWLENTNEDEQTIMEVKDTVRLLVNLGATLNSKAGDKNLLLPLLALSRRHEYGAKIAAKELLKQGADPNIPDLEGATALHHRARGWDDELVKNLLNAGANIEAKDNDSRTPLHWACRYSGPRTVKHLLLHDADCHARDHTGATPLHCAAQSIQPTYEMTAMLIQKGANVRSADHSGATPLHLAAKAGNTNTVWVFIRYDANPEAVDINGKTAMHYAAEQASIIGGPERNFQSHLKTWFRLFKCSEKWCQRNKTRPRTLFKRARSQILRTDHSWGDFSQVKSETLARP